MPFSHPGPGQGNVNINDLALKELDEGPEQLNRSRPVIA
jgi:hypothetical protein